MDKKSPDAFRTISEVAEWLDTPAHVLRFWESRFSQVKPVKRAGGRRYYRPADMLLLGGIKKLLHEDGMTIRGVQKLLREEGVKHVASFSAPIDGDAPSAAAVKPAKPTTADDLTVDEAPMQVDVPQDPLENVVQMANPAATPDADIHDEPPSETEAEADLPDLERLDGPPSEGAAPDEPDSEALFAHSLNTPEDEPASAEDAPDQTDEPVLPFGRGRMAPSPAQETSETAQAASNEPAEQDQTEPQTAPALGTAIPDDPEDSDLHANVIPAGYDAARMLRQAQSNGTLDADAADRLLPFYARLVALRGRMDKR